MLELARLRDEDLCHVCHALVCDLLNEAKKQSLKEIHTEGTWTHGGDSFYFDAKTETAVGLTKSATTASSWNPDYSGAAEMLVKDKRLRAALPKRVRQTLEMIFPQAGRWPRCDRNS